MVKLEPLINMRYKVIFDTNSIRNAESALDFLGGRQDLERFLKVSEIIIPEIVIEEIKCQKKKHLLGKRDSFLSNPFQYLMGIDRSKVDNFDMNKWVSELKEKEGIQHTIISLTKNKEEILDKIKLLCLDNLPPFDGTSDRGFKDAYIYFTVLEYLGGRGIEKDGQFFFATKDDRLRQAFENDSHLRVVRDYDEFEKYIDTYFREEYFISRLREEIDKDIKADDIEDIWLNSEENWIIKLTCNEKTYFIEADFSSREIINFTDFNFLEGVNGLIVSGSFSATHSWIGTIKEYVGYFPDEAIKNLIKAAVENSQIHSIAEDEDVKEFFIKVYEAKPQIIPEYYKNRFEDYFIKQIYGSF